MYRSQLLYFEYSANTLAYSIKFCRQILIMEYINLFPLFRISLMTTELCTKQILKDGDILLCSILGKRDQNGLSQEAVTEVVQEHGKDALEQEQF